jgi:hypothetical protein
VIGEQVVPRSECCDKTSANMMTPVEELYEKAVELPETDRALLAGLLIESLEGEPDEAVNEGWLAETRRRVSELESGAARSLPRDFPLSSLRPRAHPSPRDWNRRACGLVREGGPRCSGSGAGISCSRP